MWVELVAGRKVLKRFRCKYAKFDGNICIYSLDHYIGCPNRDIIDRYKDRLLLLCIRVKKKKVKGGKDGKSRI